MAEPAAEKAYELGKEYEKKYMGHPSPLTTEQRRQCVTENQRSRVGTWT